MAETRPTSDKGNDWLAAVYDTYAAGLYRYAVMLLADAAAAEDVIQQVFVKIVASGRKSAEINELAHYLRAAVRNECYQTIHCEQSRRRVMGQLCTLRQFQPIGPPTALRERVLDNTDGV